MSIENQKNRDLFLKICFMYFLNNILNVLDIDEEIDDILPTELITVDKKGRLKIFDDLQDFRVSTKSGKIIIFEFKKNTLRSDDLQQLYNYYKRTYCKEKTDIIAILIVISKEGKITEYKELDITYHPRIIKTKKINKQEDLKIIRDKFENNEILTSMQCSLLITFPLFELNEKESKIVEEMCNNIKFKKHCIPKEKIDEIIMAMYLNILEYIEPDKIDNLMEMIEVTTRTEGVIAKMKREERNIGKNNGITQGERNIILELLKKYSLTEVSSMIEKDESEIRKIVGID
ncbi:hypothetical protein [uncultured Methanobrevibacter sp.]|uniref:hypothetical protein n=1 Tax=uncultured Methanobrevibacter sp. TaxID=253161 RepID=UPI0025D83B5B|nr:hypothetical protein [uncultured Methanobrevibacter sp.]